MNSELLQALLAGAASGGGGGGNFPLIAGAATGGLPAGLIGGLLAQKLRQRRSGPSETSNPIYPLLSGDPASGQPIA